MRFTRREALAGAGALVAAAPRIAGATVTPGKPFAGQTVKAMVVRSSQYAAQAKRLPAFEAATGIKVEFVDVPFGSMREKLAAEIEDHDGAPGDIHQFAIPRRDLARRRHDMPSHQGKP